MIERIPSIPLRIDHFKYTDQGVILDGVITRKEISKDFLRFKEAVVDNVSDIAYHLEFDTDFVGNRIVKGTLRSEVKLQCQRCMNDFILLLKCELASAFVCNEAEEQKAGQSDYDVFLLSPREYLDIRTLIEDELLLSLPQIAMHSLDDCSADVVFLDSDSEPAENSLEQMGNNPFAVLKDLKL